MGDAIQSIAREEAHRLGLGVVGQRDRVKPVIPIRRTGIGDVVSGARRNNAVVDNDFMRKELAGLAASSAVLFVSNTYRALPNEGAGMSDCRHAGQSKLEAGWLARNFLHKSPSPPPLQLTDMVQSVGKLAVKC